MYNGKGKEVDVKKLAEKYDNENYDIPDNKRVSKESYEDGYNQCLSDNADKKFTLENINKAIQYGVDWIRKGIRNEKDDRSFEEVKSDFIKSITKEQPKSDTVMVEYDENVGIGGNGIDFYSRPKLKDGNICIVR